MNHAYHWYIVLCTVWCEQLGKKYKFWYSTGLGKVFEQVSKMFDQARQMFEQVSQVFDQARQMFEQVSQVFEQGSQEFEQMSQVFE